jgi:hypothetical protein
VATVQQWLAVPYFPTPFPPLLASFLSSSPPLPLPCSAYSHHTNTHTQDDSSEGVGTGGSVLGVAIDSLLLVADLAAAHHLTEVVDKIVSRTCKLTVMLSL